MYLYPNKKCVNRRIRVSLHLLLIMIFFRFNNFIFYYCFSFSFFLPKMLVKLLISLNIKYSSNILCFVWNKIKNNFVVTYCPSNSINNARAFCFSYCNHLGYKSESYIYLAIFLNNQKEKCVPFFSSKLKFIKMQMKGDLLLRLNRYLPLMMEVHVESESAKTIGMIDSEVEVSPYSSLKPSYQQIHFSTKQHIVWNLCLRRYQTRYTYLHNFSTIGICVPFMYNL